MTDFSTTNRWPSGFAKEDGSARAGKQYKAQKGEVIFEDQELPG